MYPKPKNIIHSYADISKVMRLLKFEKQSLKNKNKNYFKIK